METIEEKLSAIKAINEEIARCDRAIQDICFFKGQQRFEISLQRGIEKPTVFILPPRHGEIICNKIWEYYTDRRAELITKATELMK